MRSGKGYGSEATSLFVDYGFSRLKLHRISLRVFAENMQSRANVEKAGFHIEGVAKDTVWQDGKFRDMVFMARLEKKES